MLCSLDSIYNGEISCSPVGLFGSSDLVPTGLNWHPKSILGVVVERRELELEPELVDQQLAQQPLLLPMHMDLPLFAVQRFAQGPLPRTLQPLGRRMHQRR